MPTSNRRFFLKGMLATTAGMWGRGALSADSPKRARLPVAGVATVYRRNSHAHVILGKILEGFNQDGGDGPDLQLVSLYVDQMPRDDMSQALSREYGVRLAKTIDEAVTLGGDRVEVAGVLSIGEHGRYPNDPVTNQRQYPRKRFFDAIAAAMRRGGKVVPVFNDKHLSYRTDEGLAMYRTAQAMKMPFMAGSSLPVAWRIPPLELPLGTRLTGALAVGYGGVESYGFHALETLQCMVERRQGGEAGVAAVRAAHGPAVLEAERQGYWSRELLAAALEAQSRPPVDDWESVVTDPKRPFFLIDYRDGFKACVAMLNGIAAHFSFAAQTAGRPDPVATHFALQNGPPYRHFEWLVRAVEHMVHTGRPAYPVERTVLTTGILDAAMRSLAEGGRPIETPDLKIAYQAADWAPAPGRPPEPRSW